MLRITSGLLAVASLGAAIPELASRILLKDVVIVGGGASGAYAAVRLKEDYGKDILLIEKKDHLVSLPSSPDASHCGQD